MRKLAYIAALFVAVYAATTAIDVSADAVERSWEQPYDDHCS